MDDKHEQAISRYISGSTPFIEEGIAFASDAEAQAYALGYNFGYIQAMLDRVEKTLEGLNEVAATPAQVEYEKRAAAREEQWKKEIGA